MVISILLYGSPSKWSVCEVVITLTGMIKGKWKYAKFSIQIQNAYDTTAVVIQRQSGTIHQLIALSENYLQHFCYTVRD